jgi:Protein of unknown function (DUF429)
VMSALTADLQTLKLMGVDFTSAPRKGKPITWASGMLRNGVLRLEAVLGLPSIDAFDAALRTPGPWVAAFDLPFGLPRELVEHLGWPNQWIACMTHYASLSRDEIRSTFAAFCAARPVGSKFAHRACDGPAGSSPSMKWVNPPVALMMHAGVPRLISAGVHLPGLHDGDRTRVALEGYPGLVARDLIGRRSYKSDDVSKQTADRLIARKDIVDAIEQGRSRYAVRLSLRPAQRESLIDDAGGDRLDAVLCMLQAAWAVQQPGFGLPAQMDPLEGWIVGA